MILTDKFVVLNLPKTGSTFIRYCLQQIHSRRWQGYSMLRKAWKLILRSLFNNQEYCIHKVPEVTSQATIRHGKFTEHGKRFQIPKRYQNKPIITVYRDVKERYVSLYEFRDWVKAPWLAEETLTRLYPQYPNLTFEQFLDLMISNNPFLLDDETKNLVGYGTLSIQFILFYHSDPYHFFEEFPVYSPKALASFRSNVVNVSFLKNAYLNEELYQWLRSHGYEEIEINWILSEGKKNVSKPPDKSYDDYFTPYLLSKLKKEEAFLFDFYV